MSFEEKYGLIHEVILEEEDAPFDFDTKKYLPVGFGLSKTLLDAIVEINIEEEDEAFEFDTKMYLPKGFKASRTTTASTEIQ